jgi:hypothetical protein
MVLMNFALPNRFIPVLKFISVLLAKKNYRVIKELLKILKILKEVMILKKEL